VLKYEQELRLRLIVFKIKHLLSVYEQTEFIHNRSCCVDEWSLW